MTDKRISELTSATSLADADILPIVQSGETKKLTGSALKTYAQNGVVLSTEKGANSGIATLGSDGKLTASQLPDLAISDYLGSVATQSAMLALSGQKGDWAIRSDLGSTWIISGSNPTLLASWTELSYPTAPVTSVAGKTGAVSLVKGDVGLGNVDNTSDANKPISSATQTALDAKQPLDSDITAIAALSGTSGLLKKTAADTWSLDTSSYLTGNQTITYTGDATGSGTTSVALTLANSGATAGIYKSVTVNAKGLVTGGTNPTTLAGFGITDAQNTLVSGINIKTIGGASILGAGDIAVSGGSIYGLFRKEDPTTVAFTKTGNFTVSTATTLYVEVNGVLKTIASSAAVTMPGSAVAGTDYAIWAKTDGALEATTSHTSPPTANARKIGGFHYAPGGNAAAQSGGNTTAQINEYTFWDLKFRPACPDPRGMTLVAGGFWCDIYLTGVDAITNGTSKYNVTHADGSSPPKVPGLFGGNGSTTYGSLTWFEASELARAFGKRPLFQSEFMAAAYGTTEASSVGTDQGSSVLNAAYTSKWGVIQASGVLWVWGQERGGAYNTGGWNANTEGRGSEYNAPNAAIFGGFWTDGADSGSRASAWYTAASASNASVGLRCACDHLLLD